MKFMLDLSQSTDVSEGNFNDWGVIEAEGVPKFRVEEATSIVQDLSTPLVGMSPASPSVSATRQINLQYQPNIEVQRPAKYMCLARAIMSLLLETTSYELDITGKSKRSLVLAAFLLSVIGFLLSLMTIYSYMMGRTRATSTHRHQQAHQRRQQLIEIMDIVFPVLQMIVSLVHLILVDMHFKKIGPIPSLSPVAFAVIAVLVFTLDDSSSGGSPETSTDRELYPIETTVNHPNSVSRSSMASGLLALHLLCNQLFLASINNIHQGIWRFMCLRLSFKDPLIWQC